MTRVLVIGDALLDVVISPSGVMRPGADVPAAIRLESGGQGANLAVRLARLGVDTALACGLGPDPAAALLRSPIEASGVRLIPLTVEATGSVAILLDAGGERTMLSHRAPFGARLSLQALPAVEWSVVSGYLLLEADAAALTRLLAARPGRRALVGCAVPDDAVAAWLAAAAALEPDLVILNRDEAATLGAAAADVIVVTDAAGATATAGNGEVRVHAAAGPPVVDTTGAGDAFAAGFLAAVMDISWPPDRQALGAALTAAVELATAVARAPGAQARVAGEAS